MVLFADAGSKEETFFFDKKNIKSYCDDSTFALLTLNCNGVDAVRRVTASFPLSEVQSFVSDYTAVFDLSRLH